MNRDDLERFADDFRNHTGLEISLVFDPSPNGLHVLTINGVDFFFNADRSGYDGWGKKLPGAESNARRGERSNRPPNSDSSVPRKEAEP